MESNTVDDLDRQLVQCLAADGRASFSAIAEVLGVSDQTVARRYNREARALYYDLELDLPVFGFRAMAWLWLSVPPAHLADVGTDLATFPEAAYVTATTGPANLAACVICRDEHSLYEFLTTKVGALPDAERVETAPVIRTIKQASPIMAPRH